jgi:ABC-2 type transport system permease protein
MKKYWQIFRISLQNTFVYRLSFTMWRLRMVIDFLTIYFFWWAIYSQYDFIGTYSRSAMLVYLLLANLLRVLVFSNTSFTACVEIANGDLNNYLLKPLNYFYNWLARDWADKVLNLLFFSVEVTFLIWLLKLPLVWPVDGWQAIEFIVAALLAAMLYFFFSFVVSSFSFWYPEHDGWPLRFLMLMFLDFLSGIAFPLDIFPSFLQQIFKVLPFSYFLFFPAQIYLNKLSPIQITQGFLIMVAWLLILIFLTKKIWKKGLRIYGAYGR